jgi:hypothetical protein
VGAGNRFGISARLTALLEAWSRIATIPLLLTWFVTQVQIMRTNMLINTKKTKFTGLNAPISLGTKKPGTGQMPDCPHHAEDDRREPRAESLLKMRDCETRPACFLANGVDEIEREQR